MNAPEAENSGPAFSTTRARSKTCPYCARPIRHPQQGRPRETCGRRFCELARRRARRRSKADRWNGMDWLEALARWGNRCSRCGREGRLSPKPRLIIPILPVCGACKRKPLGVKARRWLSRCTWGVPLPNPSVRLTR